MRPRVGVTANNFLFYVMGGAAFEGREHNVFENRPTVVGANRTFTSDGTRTGWTVGAGVEAGLRLPVWQKIKVAFIRRSERV